MIRIEPWQIEIWQIEIWQIEIRQIEISGRIDAGFWPDWALRRFVRFGLSPRWWRQGRTVAPAGAHREGRHIGPGKPDGLLWTSSGAPPDHAGGFGRGDSLEFAFGNELPVPALLNWHGLDGVQAVEPLTVQTALRPGSSKTSRFRSRHAGTFLCDLRLLGDSASRPARAMALIVGESETVAVDRDEIVLLEDWRLRPDGTALAPRQRRRGCEPPPHRQWRDFVRYSATLQ